MLLLTGTTGGRLNVPIRFTMDTLKLLFLLVSASVQAEHPPYKDFGEKQKSSESAKQSLEIWQASPVTAYV